MKIQLVKEKKEVRRMSTLLGMIEDALILHGFKVSEVNHLRGFIRVVPDRGITQLSIKKM